VRWPFEPRMKPLAHQQKFLDENSRRACWALFDEQGLGKTKQIIDNAAILYSEGVIDAALVVAPNTVHRNWAVEELPKHWPANLPALHAFAWDTDKSANKSHKEEFGELLRSKDFVWLCMSYDSLMTDLGKKASWDLLRSRRCLYVLDESQRAKTPSAKRTQRIIASGVYAPYRRIASGTPMDLPLDIYSQARFLDPDFWIRTFGIGGFTSFKHHFAEIVKVKTNADREFEMIKGYRNLDELEAALKTIGQRVLKADVLDLPPKVYRRVFHELTPAQRRAYEELKSEALTFLDSGDLVTAELALTRIIRMQQITSGFVVPETGKQLVRFDPNPRAAALREILTDLTRPSIIWGRFVEDVRMAAEASRSAGRRPVVFDGSRPSDSLDPFHAGDADDFIANLESGAREGLTLVEADTVIYVSNSTKLINRRQSEDRAHRIGQTRSVNYIDLLAERTLDSGVLASLQLKGSAAGRILGDPDDAWLVPSADPARMLRELLE